MQGLYKIFAKELLATSQRITNSLKDSEDILQEAFLNSYHKINQLKEDKNYGAWIKKIVINASLQWVKKRQHFENLDVIEFADDKLDEDNNLYSHVSFDILKQAIQNLPNGSREIFSLHLIEGYKHREIAEELKISVSTSKSQYRYALKVLREKLAPKVYE